VLDDEHLYIGLLLLFTVIEPSGGVVINDDGVLIKFAATISRGIDQMPTDV
jgi:hypothetical protein